MSNNSNTQLDEELNDKEEGGDTYTLHRGDTVIRDGEELNNDSEEEEEEEEELNNDSEEEEEEEEEELNNDSEGEEEETLYTEEDEKIIKKLHMFEQMFETFLKPIITFFTKINYSNTFIQISIIISIVYIISSIISMIHINVDYKLPP